jgi:Ni/Co efflux regulator RcnB
MYMTTNKQKLPAILLAAAFACTPAFALSQQPYPGQDSPKQDMKNAGHETKQAAKDAGNGTKQGTKKAYHKTKRGTKKAYRKTKDTTRGAVNGAKDGARTPE